MKLLSLILSLIPSIVLSQTLIWSEDFESYTDGTQNAVKWTTSASNCDDDGAPGTAGNNFWGTRTTLGDKEFCCEDIEGLTCCSSGPSGEGFSDNSWTSQNISIAGYSTVSIYIDMRAEGNMEGNGGCLTCGVGNDVFKAQYRVNGGAWITFLSICGLSSGQRIIDCVDISAGTTLNIRVLLGNQANDEEYYFDDVRVYDATCSVALPVELLSFTGEYIMETGENVLQWKTASESNSSYFSLEHSSDGITWSTASIVPAAGNSTEEISYSETHRTNNQIDYYRLRQFDFSGDFKTYQTISVDKKTQQPISTRYFNLMGQEISPDSASGPVIIEFEMKSGKVERRLVFLSL